MKRNLPKIIVFIEVQVILLVLVYLVIKMEVLEKKVYTTNKYVYEAIENNRIQELKEINKNDIVIGLDNAPVTMFVYSRFDCSACNSFFKTNYQQLKTEFIDRGAVKLVLRYLVHPSKPQTLYATKCAYYAYQNGYYDLFINQMDSIYPNLDTTIIQELLLNQSINPEDLINFTNDVAIEKELLQQAVQIRAAGISYTPTLFINNQILIGNHKYQKIRELILTELNKGRS